MINIPTDLLRTLVTVVDQRSFTRAARTLGVTQPAVSAHIKRLQSILRGDLFDRSGPGLSLTPKGELIVGQARRLLSINDAILHVAEPTPDTRTIRLGMPTDFLGGNLPTLLAGLRKRWPDLHFSVQHGNLDRHLTELRLGRLDIAVGLSLTGAASDARHHWTERMVWVRGGSTRLDPSGPVPLVSLSDNCVYYRAAVDTLKRSGREIDLVFVGPTIVSLAAGVGAGLGVMALPRSRVWSSDLVIWENPPLPKLPDLVWSVHLGESSQWGPLEDLADAIAAEMRARTAAAAKPAALRNAKATTALARQAAAG